MHKQAHIYCLNEDVYLQTLTPNDKNIFIYIPWCPQNDGLWNMATATCIATK